MPQPKDPTKYQDLIEGILYPAQAEPVGKRVTCLTPQDAFKLKMRLHAAVKILRRQSMEVLPPEHPRYGKSDFDTLVIQQDGCVLLIRRAEPENVEANLNIKIESLL